MTATVKIIELSNHFKDALQIASGDNRINALKAGGNVVRNHAKLNIMSQGLVDIGTLKGSISVEKDTDTTVAIGTNIKYGHIHEVGGTIVPRKAKMLSWIDKQTGNRIFAKSVHIPARPYLRPALDENESDIIKAVGQNLLDQLKGILG